ncbi:uncharacterized protein B0P05DRAFT_267346 [Gilbertella persicaria]|uniref:uncharacterized protein n=1 Tax=Gilbertella persicaria TaxID=101096 RepID=UPI00221F0832|nr:uncharacterized protein B0P05DRAFT_267346 [Gilbertella persicaria]KAI8091485.1 hypothetical protein B0P05DRAFT_267346 [Gilbertella persicaria]
MVQFLMDTFVQHVSELDQLLFQDGQERLLKEIDDFIDQFETRQDLFDTAAKMYAQLTVCDKKLNSLKTVELDTTLDKLHQTQHRLDQLLSKTEPRTVHLEEKRQAFLTQQTERKRQIEAQITRESDKIDEYYAKKTRESIYRNLVGSNQWLSLDKK